VAEGFTRVDADLRTARRSFHRVGAITTLLSANDLIGLCQDFRQKLFMVQFRGQLSYQRLETSETVRHPARPESSEPSSVRM